MKKKKQENTKKSEKIKEENIITRDMGWADDHPTASGGSESLPH
jgi:hypothetical protein